MRCVCGRARACVPVRVSVCSACVRACVCRVCVSVCVCVPVQLELWLNLGSVAFTSCDVRMNATHQSERRKMGRVRSVMAASASKDKSATRSKTESANSLFARDMTGRYGGGCDGTGVCLA